MAGRDWCLAWLATEGEPFDPVAHRRRDVSPSSVAFSEEEGTDAVTVTVTREALPSGTYTGREWAMLSYEHPDGDLVPVARMRLKKRPLGQRDGLADLVFEALPSDWQARLDALLGTLRTAPAFDPVLVASDRRNDEKEVLDGHSRVVHYDRVTGEATAPSILGVGLPVRPFGVGDLVGWEDGGGVKVSQTETPLAAVQILLTSEWVQVYAGEITATNAIQSLFPAGKVETLSPDKLEQAWFRPGSAVNGSSGWTVSRSRLRQVSAPDGRPAKVGPVRGKKARYNYVDDQDLVNPRAMSLDVAYYEPDLGLSYRVEQKRVERVEVLVGNAAALAGEGAVRTLELKTQDVTLDDVTPPFVGLAYYTTNSVVRVGATNWGCLKGHFAKENFGADAYTIENGVLVPLWAPLPNDASPLGGSDRDTYYLTPRGRVTIEAAILKAIRLIAESSRCVEVEFTVPFEDVCDLTTASVCRVEVDDPLIPGGWAEGKVTRISVTDSDVAEWARATITIKCCPGTGQPVPQGTAGSIGYTPELWDRVGLDSWAGAQPVPLPVADGSALLLNSVEAQLAYVQANDYRRDVPGRNDKTLNDPQRLLKDVPTTIVLSLTDLSAKPDMTNVITITAGAWAGPRQIELPE